MRSEQLLQPPTQLGLAGTGFIEIGGALRRGAAFQRAFEQRLIGQIGGIHWMYSSSHTRFVTKTDQPAVRIESSPKGSKVSNGFKPLTL
jgi:hypothetical protein